MKRQSPTSLSRLTKECDALFSRIVRQEGRCASRRLARHGGVLQCAHGISRAYKATRWDLRNAWCLCQACHMYFTHHPLEWDLWLHETWGEELYAEMRALALTHRKPDVRELVVELRTAALEAKTA